MKLLETICIKHGAPQNLCYHQSRLDRSYRQLFGGNCPFELYQILSASELSEVARIKCSIIISRDEIEEVKHSVYSVPEITRLRIVDSEIDYSHKYADRSELTKLKNSHSSNDEILIEKNGLLSDTSFTNVCFLKKGKWFTPRKPLLHGTKRQILLDKGKLSAIDIKREEIAEYECVSLINAMLDLSEIVIPVSNIDK